MNKINCSVDNCSHNSSGTCFANRINIGGKDASSNCETCCGSFLDSKNYSSLTNNINSSIECDCLVCSVESCSHNCNSLCNLDSINVSGNNVKLYNETNCSSFSSK